MNGRRLAFYTYGNAVADGTAMHHSDLGRACAYDGPETHVNLAPIRVNDLRMMRDTVDFDRCIAGIGFRRQPLRWGGETA